MRIVRTFEPFPEPIRPLSAGSAFVAGRLRFRVARTQHTPPDPKNSFRRKPSAHSAHI